MERGRVECINKVASGLDPTRSIAEVRAFFTLWKEYSVARKSQRYVLRLVMKSLDKPLYEAVTMRSPNGPALVLDLELYFVPTVPHYLLASHVWVPNSPHLFAELIVLKAAEPWRSSG